MAVTNLLYRVAGLCRGLDFQDEERPSQQHRTPILLAERLPTLTERMHEAEEAAGQLIVKLVVQTALTKAVEAHNKAAGARALAEIQEQHEQHLQAQQELSALRHMWQQHEQQLQERHAAALTEASEQRSQQLQHHTLEHAQALTKVQQQHEQEIAQLQLEHGLAVEQAEATSAGQLQQLQVQHEHVLSQLRDQHTAQLAWLEKKWSDAQRAAVEAAQADTEARLSQQERVHEQALAEQHTGLSEQGKQEVEELKQQLADLQADLQLQRSKTFEAEQQLQQVRSTGERQEAELAGLQRGIETAKQDKAAAQAEAHRLKEEFESLATSLQTGQDGWDDCNPDPPFVHLPEAEPLTCSTPPSNPKQQQRKSSSANGHQAAGQSAVENSVIAQVGAHSDLGASLRASILALGASLGAPTCDLDASLGAPTPALGASLRASTPALGASPRAPTSDMGASLRASRPALDASLRATTPGVPRPPNGPLIAPLGQGPQPITCPSWMPTLASSPSAPSMSCLQPGVRPPLARFAGNQPAARGPQYQPPDTCTPIAHPQHQHLSLCTSVPAVTDEVGVKSCSPPSSAKPLRSLGSQTARHAETAAPSATHDVVAEDASGVPGSRGSTATSSHQSHTLAEGTAVGRALQASSVSAQQAQQAGCGHGSTSGKSWLSAARQGLRAGLRNGIGDNHCFLNAAVQCLYHCRTFRHAIMQWPQAVYQGNAIVSALVQLFHALAQQARQAQGPTPTEVDPTRLREALSKLPSNKFGVGEMSHAAELLMVLYRQLQPVAVRAGQPDLMDSMFGLNVQEAVVCTKCGVRTRDLQYVAHFHNVTATILGVEQHRQPGRRLGQLLQSVDLTCRSCDPDHGGCGAENTLRRKLLAPPPKIFTMQVVWQSFRVSEGDLQAGLKGLRKELDLADMYERLSPKQHAYRLCSMFCYYGRHYMAVALMPDGTWNMFDDTTVTQIRRWPDVINKCVLGRWQPAVLFYRKL